MKTAISVPDATFERVTRRAAELGMSRSELFARAADHYLDELDAGSLTARIDDALRRIGEDPDESEVDAAMAGRRVLAATDDDW
ncbi:ribbon-helix-helix protein, CopG family [Mycobacterium sp. M1]|uniref:Ribbon-helix-helix protein, CopG family n=1 Tax=Mycolicibacter acidiphilus TaxID=2835306 RepID=A0ABS5RGM2_9MYCO|nr:ribbon-helix-helix protein, CopG family [Mycolicibacter acidiphilus]MBS9533431.1 ribbon-helix-helix protein, CopG family [Mycolicibacter acidiphilus]